MHKLVTRRIILSLLFLGSLVIFMAIPTNMNLISNTETMAQEYDNGYSSYSEYPTKDYKYECQTGPFEGFFVESVEFCDKRDSSQNYDHWRISTEETSV